MFLKIEMRIRVFLLFGGGIIASLGIIFHYQGKSVIGPETSFMYANPEWVFYGIEIFVIGIVTIGTGIAINLIQRTKSKKGS